MSYLIVQQFFVYTKKQTTKSLLSCIINLSSKQIIQPHSSFILRFLQLYHKAH